MSGATDSRAIHILARTLLRDLLARGYDANDLIGLATELVDQVADHIATQHGRVRHDKTTQRA